MNRTSSLFPLLLPLLLLLSSFCHSEVSSRVVFQVHVVPELSKVSGERVSVQGRLEVRAGTPSPEADLRVLLEEEGRHLHVLLHDALTVGNVLQLDLSEFVAGEVDPAVQLSELGAQLLQAEVTGVIVSETPKVMLVESLRVMDDGEAKRGGGWSDVGSYESEAFVGEAVHSVQFRPLVVLADFQDAQHACATGVGPSYGGAQGLMFDGTENVRDMFMEFSKNRTHLVRDTDYANTQIAGPYTLSYTTGTAGGACNNYAQQDADARALAAADGFNLTEFTSVVVVVPYDGDCGWAGFGTLAQCETDGVCSAHMLRCEPATWVHELGHNLYLRHSGEDKEDDETYPDSLDYYLDHSCAMGNYPDWMKLNAVKLYQTGWIDTAQVVETSTTVGAGTHIVSALDIKVGDATPYPQIVVFNDSSSKTYFLSARAKIGFSDSMRDDYVSGVQVHYQTTTPFSWIVTTLNDTTQTHTASNSGYTFRYDSRSTLNATFMLVPPGCDPDDTSGTTCEYDWKLGAWGNCDCGTDSQSRTVECADTQGTGSTVDDGFCVAANNFVKPNTSQTCDCGLCEGVTCDSPPTCHEQPHSCDPGTGVCSYTPSAAGSACGTGQDCDGAGNCVADVTAPTPTLSVSPSTDPSNAATVTLTVDFGETMVGFDVSDIGVGNGAASNLAGGTNGLYTATITPTTDGTVTIDIAAAAATDDASNDNIAATQLSYVYDGTPPAPALSISPSADPSNAATVTLTIDFGETVVGFELTDIAVGNGAASDLTGGTNGLYTATLTPTTDGTVTVDVAGSVATDSANNVNDAATQLSYVYDGTPPTPALSISPSADPSNAATVTLTIDFGETVVGFELTDIAVGNGAASNLAGGTNGLYTATITPTTDGTVTVDIAGSVATDSANNVNDAATQLSYVYDATAPTPTMSITPSADPSNAVVVTLTVDFGEGMIGFELSDVIVSSGFVAELGGGTSGLYTMKLSGERDGTVTVDIAGSVATDTAGNLNNAAAQLSFVVDRTKPAPSWVVDDSGATKVYTLTFNEAVTGLDINSFSAPPGASLSAFNTNSPTEVTVSATPANGDPFAITLLAGEATDSAGNTNDESGSPWVNFDCTVPSEAATTDTPLTLDVSGTGIAGNQLTIKFVQKSKYYNTQVGFESSTCSVDDFVWTEGHVNPATCEREWTGSAHWFDFVANCNLERVVSPIATVDHIIYRANMYVDHNENIPGLRTGDPDIVRSIRSRLPFEVRMPTTVTATASQVRVFAPVVVEAAILEQGVTGSPGGAKTGSLYLLTSVQYPFKLTSSTGTTTPAGVAVSSGNPTRDTSVTDECLDNSANPCTQQWDWSFTPVNINVCELDGEYSVTFQLDCQASQAGDCPLDPNPGSVTLAFTIDTTNFCPLVVEELGVSASLDTYVSSSHNTIKHYFIDGQRIYALAPVNAAIAIESTTIVQASIVQPSGTEVFMLVDGNPTRTALGDDVDFQKVDGGAGAAGSNSLPSFNFVADSEAFGIDLDLNEVITLKARIAITYANAGQSKRSEVIDVDLQYAPAQQQQRGNGAADVTAAFGMSPASTTASASTSPVAVAGFNAFVVAAGAFAAMVILVSLLTIQRGRAKIARLRVLAAKDGCSI